VKNPDADGSDAALFPNFLDDGPLALDAFQGALQLTTLSTSISGVESQFGSLQKKP
jgi:hypothetical protein